MEEHRQTVFDPDDAEENTKTRKRSGLPETAQSGAS